MILIKYFKEKIENFDINLFEKAQVDSFSPIEAKPFTYLLKSHSDACFPIQVVESWIFYVPSVTLLKVLHLTNLTTSNCKKLH